MSAPSSPVLNQPINEILIVDNTPVLSFTIPTDSDSDNLVFQIELDTQNPVIPSSLDYRKFESRNLEGVWQYWSGSNFVDMPRVGVSSAFYNNECLFTVPIALRNAIWYWKVSASDNLVCSKFNQGYFNQKRFCSSI
jgi:hypothetical protein